LKHFKLPVPHKVLTQLGVWLAVYLIIHGTFKHSTWIQTFSV